MRSLSWSGIDITRTFVPVVFLFIFLIVKFGIRDHNLSWSLILFQLCNNVVYLGKKMRYLPIFLLFLPLLSSGQYIQVGITDNSVKDEFKSVTGQFYEIGYSSKPEDRARVNYGVRVDMASFPGESNYGADFLSVLINPRFYVEDGSGIRMVAGLGIRMGGNLDKASRLNYLQSWTMFQIGIEWRGLEFTGFWDISHREGVFRGTGKLKVGGFALLYGL